MRPAVKDIYFGLPPAEPLDALAFWEEIAARPHCCPEWPDCLCPDLDPWEEDDEDDWSEAMDALALNLGYVADAHNHSEMLGGYNL